MVRLGGNEELVSAERAALAAIGDTTTVSSEMWTRLRRCESLAEHGDIAVLRWANLPSRIAETWARTVGLCDACPQALVHGSVARGIVRVVIPRPDPVALARAVSGGDDGRTPHSGAPPIPERLPARLWSALGGSAPLNGLTQGVRRAFDPAHILNPGLMDQGWAHA
jgi:hypothetical protein